MLTPSTATDRQTCRTCTTHGTLLSGRAAATVALAFVLLGFNPARSYGQAPQCFAATTNPAVFVEENPCTAETMALTVRFTEVLCGKSDGNGGQHAMVRFLAHGTAEPIIPNP